jgi:exodeoxyribonuclease-3
VKIATWNVNSLRARAERVQGWIEEHAPDVLLLQETKCSDANFPSEIFSTLGYEVVHHGNGQWNGVAVVSRVGLDAPRGGFFDDDLDAIAECRIVTARCGGVRCTSVYVPNGRTVGSEHYLAKLEWLRRLRVELDETAAPDDPIVVGGDFNIAPEDRDVWDIAEFEGATHVTPAERAALADVMAFGLTDSLRALHPDGPGPFSWWDYRNGAFHRGWGMRIDHLLVSEPVLAGLTSVEVDREERKGTKPSDHAPVVLELRIPTA